MQAPFDALTEEGGLRYPPFADINALDIAAIGYNPNVAFAEPQFTPDTAYWETLGEHPSPEEQRLNHLQSMHMGLPTRHQLRQPSQSPDRNHQYNPAFARPNSGFYSHTNMSSSSGLPPDNNNQRVRAESTQTANFAVRRSNSRAAAAAATQGIPMRGQEPRLYRQGSYNSSSTAGNPPRRAATNRPGDQDVSSSSPRITPAGESPYTAEGLTASSEEWKVKGAATGTVRSVDLEGKPVIKVVKKGVKDFNFGRTLGEGSYSTVLAATDRQSLREYAIKVLDKKHIIKEKKVKYVNIEKDTLNRLTDHPGIVRLYYTFQDERSLYFVLDLATGGELLGILRKMSTFDLDCTKFYAAQILDAVEYMHLRGIIHRDLKPENVLLDDQMHVKITDFGTAKILDLPGPSRFGKVSVTNDPLDGADTDRAVSFVGTAEYVSPELLTDKNACKASDLWAFGCIIYQLLAGRPPFKAGNEYQTFQKIVGLEYSFPDRFPEVAKDLVEKLLVLNPADRLPIDAIKRHPFFDGIQWGKGLWKQKPPKLRSFNPHAQYAQNRSISDRVTNSAPPPISKPPSAKPSQSSSTQPGNVSSRTQPRLITELAPPSQLDIDWSPVLTKNNERILKLGNMVVYSMPAPNSSNSRNGPPSDVPVEPPSKFSRFFGASGTKKRQRLVMITSGGRIVLAPAGGDKKESKHVIELTDPDTTWKIQQDAKGYSVWCVYTVSYAHLWIQNDVLTLITARQTLHL